MFMCDYRNMASLVRLSSRIQWLGANTGRTGHTRNREAKRSRGFAFETRAVGDDESAGAFTRAVRGLFGQVSVNDGCVHFFL
jgi:hypothetical protein